ncbi:MAG TPA: hypothetical protein VGK30_14015 [Candidatus Binatia bacterium]
MTLDYLAYDRARQRVWVPAGDTGTVAVFDRADDHMMVVPGFATAEVERHGGKRRVGPSSATVGEGTVYVGNRADSSVCAVDAVSLRRGACITLASAPDGLAYVAAMKEVWVTTPRDRAITILDAANPLRLTTKGKIALAGAPEGYAVDDAQGVFYTNLEDGDRTLAIAVASRRITSTWQPECGAAGPRGLAFDPAFHMLVVACTDHLVALDVVHDGAVRSSLPIGDGIDNLDLLASRHEVYAAAGRAATLSIVRLDAQGQLSPRATVPTRAGARNAVVTDEGVAYLTDAAGGQLLVVTP